jgi:STE24 endopeptidase
MLVFLQYLVALIIVATVDPESTPPAPDWYGIALVLVGYAAAARVAGVLVARRAAADDGDDAHALPLLLATGTWGRLAAFGAFYAIAGPLGGVLLPSALGVGEWVIVPRLVQLLPYVLLVASLAWGLQPGAAAMRIGARTPARAVRAELRDGLLPAAPVFALIALEGLGGLAAGDPSLARAMVVLRTSPATAAILELAVLFVLLLMLPFLLRLVLRAKPLPPGPLRTRLDGYAKRIGFRARDVLVLPTSGESLNAVVAGALPRFRYVFITDGLLKTLSEDEVEAVFAHEAGHARRGHVLLFFGFTAVLSLVAAVPELAGAVGLGPSALPQFVRLLLVVGIWLGVVMGWISRRFEQEADVFGIETIGRSDADVDPASHPFGRALARIGEEVGAIREVTGWRHFSIADRVAFVRAYLVDPEVRRRHRRSLLWLRGSVLTVIVGIGLVALARVPGEVAAWPSTWRQLSDPQAQALDELRLSIDAPEPGARAAHLARSAEHALVAGRHEEAARRLREAIALGLRDPRVLELYAVVLEKAGRPLGARRVWGQITDDERADERTREEARRKLDGDRR